MSPDGRSDGTVWCKILRKGLKNHRLDMDPIMLRTRMCYSSIPQQTLSLFENEVPMEKKKSHFHDTKASQGKRVCLGIACYRDFMSARELC